MTEVEENINNSQNKIRVGVLRGGDEEHFDLSLREGSEAFNFILENLAHKYTPVDIFIDKDGIWHARGVPVFLSDIPQKIDVVWNTAHNSLGQMLRNFNIPVFDAGHNSSFLGINNPVLQNHIKNMGGTMPRYILLPTFQEDFDGDKKLYAQIKAKEVFHKFGSPWVIKSFSKESGVGIHVAKTFPELISAIEDMIDHSTGSILIEELVLGKAVSTHSLKGFRGEDYYNFPLLDIKTDHLFALNHFSDKEKEDLFSFTKNLHKSLDNNTHYLKIDYVIKPNGKVYVTGTSFSPDFRQNSHLEKSVLAVGSKIHYVFEHILDNLKG